MKNDLISRRKAFEYFVTLWNCIGTIMDRNEWEDICMTTANEVPSAQPEIIKCKDCINWTKQNDSLQGRCDRYGFYPTGYYYCAGAKERGINERVN